MVHHKIQCGFPRFSPPSAIFVFSEGPKFCRRFSNILERISGASRKPSKRHSNLCTRVPKQRSARAILAKLAKLANFEKLAKLALQDCTLPATVCNSAVTRGGVGAANAAPRVRTSSYIRKPAGMFNCSRTALPLRHPGYLTIPVG